MTRLSAGWVMASRSAAARIFPDSATARNLTRSSRLSNMSPLRRLGHPLSSSQKWAFYRRSTNALRTWRGCRNVCSTGVRLRIHSFDGSYRQPPCSRTLRSARSMVAALMFTKPHRTSSANSR